MGGGATDTVCVFSGLGHVYGVLKSISSPRRAGPGTFYITVMPEGASWACQYLLHKDNMMWAYSAGPVREEAVISRNNVDGPVVVEL